MFRSLSVFNYRLWFIGGLVSNVGTWVQMTAISWVVLTELTAGDASAMGITLALQFAPPLLLVSLTGWVADRFDRRRLLMVTQVALGTLGVATGILLLTGNMTLTLMYALSFALGVIVAFDNPARQTFITDLVASESASNAVALNAASMNGARLIGPAAAGALIIGVGTGWVFLLNAIAFAGMLIALALMRSNEMASRVRTLGATRLTEGFRYAARRHDLMATFAIVFVLSVFGMNFLLFASTMALEFGQRADGFGLLNSMIAVGSIVGALMAARRERARLAVVIGGTLLFTITLALSALMPSYWLYAASLVLIGFALISVLTTANAYIQTTTDPAVRGRVMALYMAILMGGTPLGAPVVGWIAAQFGPRAAILVGAGGALVAFGIGLTWLLASGRLHRHEHYRFRLALDEARPLKVVELAPAEFSNEVAAASPIRIAGDTDDPAARRAAENENEQGTDASRSPRIERRTRLSSKKWPWWYLTSGASTRR